MTDEEKQSLLDDLCKDCVRYNNITKRVNNIRRLDAYMVYILDYCKEHYSENESLVTALSAAAEETKRFCDAAIACDHEAKRKFYEKYGYRRQNWPPSGQEFDFDFPGFKSEF